MLVPIASRGRSLILFFLLLLVPGGALHAQVPAAGQPPALMPGDRLNIVIYRYTELTGTYTVTSQGTLLHPLFENVTVARIPIEEARDRMATALREVVAEPLFTFEPLYRIYVGGLVRMQGEHHFPEMSIGQAIVNAGGSTARDRRYRIRMIRDGVETVAALDGESEATLLQTPIRSGDQILVEERPTFSRSFLGPAMQVLQTVTSLVATYVFFDSVLGS